MDASYYYCAASSEVEQELSYGGEGLDWLRRRGEERAFL